MYKDKKYRTMINGKRTFLYNRYRSMMKRCYCPNNVAYLRYGGRGIRVEPHLQKWTNYVDYVHTLLPEGHTIEDMRRLGMSLDRIDNDGNYERGNLEWATKKSQVLNRNIPKSNTSGYLGVSWCKTSKKWRAELRVNYKLIYLGGFNSPAEAFDAVQKAYLKHNGPEQHAKLMERQRKHLEQR